MPYQLHEPIGEGGMAVVYRASADDGTSVALKVIKTDLLEPRMVQRFVREARVVRELSHPGIVRCVDAGQIPDGRPFIAYEWLQGSTLAEHGPATTPSENRSSTRSHTHTAAWFIATSGIGERVPSVPQLLDVASRPEARLPRIRRVRDRRGLSRQPRLQHSHSIEPPV